MKRNILIITLAALILTACGSAAEPNSAAAVDVDYPDALSARSQLMIGTLKLEETEQSVTAEQATRLLPLWQASRSLARSGTGATEEIDAVLEQINETMTREQIQVIADMHLTRADNQAFTQELGLSAGTGERAGANGGQRGQGQNMSPEERAVREAEKVDGPTGGANDALLNMLIELLESKSTHNIGVES